MKNRHFVPALFLACLVLAWGALPPRPAAADEIRSAVPGGEVRLKGAPKVGQPVTAIFDLKDYALPAGAYTSINVEFPVRPEGAKPEVRPGYPETVITFTEPGAYHVLFLLNQVSKSSCGGVKAKPLMEATLDLDVAP